MLNKYKELHEQLMDCIVAYHNLYTAWVLRPTHTRTREIRIILSDMRRIETEMRAVAQERQKAVIGQKHKNWNRQQGDSE